MKVYITAGEPSGDKLGASLMEGLKARVPEVQFTGIGGERMIGQGLESLFPMDEISVMGITEILRQYGKLKARIRETAEAIIAAKPDVLITVDLDVGVRMVAPLVENDASQLTLGLAVELDYNDVSTALTLPRFRIHE